MVESMQQDTMKQPLGKAQRRPFLRSLLAAVTGTAAYSAFAGQPARRDDSAPTAIFAARQSDASHYQTTAADAGAALVFTSDTAVTVTLSDLADGACGFFEQHGEGAITFVAGTLTPRHVADLTQTAGRYARVFYRVQGNEVVLSGDLA